MEQPITSLEFRGTIAEAIAETKRQKKVFVVYTSGENPESRDLEASTWIDPSVSTALAKYCVFLHVIEGSPEATNFSAIYPYNCSPCINAIGYNGIRLWQNEGFVAADVLASSLEKAWLDLHLQETTSVFLSAALTSRASGIPFSEQGSQETYEVLPSTIDQNLSPDSQHPIDSEARVERNVHEDLNKWQETNSLDGETLSESRNNASDSGQLSGHNAIVEKEDFTLKTEEKCHNKPEVGCPVPENSTNFSGNCLGSDGDISLNTADYASLEKRDEITESQKVVALDSAAIKSNLVVLNIKLPDGSNLQCNFSVMDTLRIVHDYTTENQTSSIGPFSLGTPYPRHVFNDQDLDCTLSALGLSGRCTLIVVPRNQTSSAVRERPSLHSSKDPGSSSEINEGYWGFAKRVLSYVNPLSYLRGGVNSSNDAKESHDGIGHYNPNSAPRYDARDSESSAGFHSPIQSTSAGGRNSSNKSRQKASGFGGNVHTLKHDEDDNSDRNVFWNGNSTQFGGDGDAR